MARSTLNKLLPVLAFSILGMIVSADEASAQCGSCVSGMYLYCNGDCPSDATGQGECTTRYDANCAEEKWCCCDNSFVGPNPPNTTTTDGYGPIVYDCPDVIDAGGDEKDPDGWAATAAIKKTSNPTYTDDVLRLVRDNVLQRSDRGKGYIDAVYKYSDDVDKILAKNPRLVVATAAMMSENLPILVKLGKGEKVSVEKGKVKEAVALLERYRDAAGENPGLQKALAEAMSGLKDREFLGELGIRVTD